jgi:hypothetical protein
VDCSVEEMWEARSTFLLASHNLPLFDRSEILYLPMTSDNLKDPFPITNKSMCRDQNNNEEVFCYGRVSTSFTDIFLMTFSLNAIHQINQVYKDFTINNVGGFHSDKYCWNNGSQVSFITGWMDGWCFTAQQHLNGLYMCLQWLKRILCR